MINPKREKQYAVNLSNDWIYLYHNKFNNDPGTENPHCGIVFTNTSSTKRLVYGIYQGIVKDTSSGNSLRMD